MRRMQLQGRFQRTAAFLSFLFLALPGFAGSAAAADCTGIGAWINEFDYDSNDGGFNNDRDEFVEIAAPAGTDLSGYHVLAVEGNAAFFTCGSGIGGSNGNAYFNATLPAGSVVGDDTGTGVGFFVVCFVSTSQNVDNAGDCDAVLPGVANDSNLKNGNLAFGGQTNCPDGVLLLDTSNQLVDAISWEGVIPNTGTYGAFFNAPNPSYNAGEDAGFTAQESLQKASSSVGRAVSAAEWQVSGGPGTATPGVLNPGQSLSCEEPAECGNGLLEGAEECDDGNLVSEDGCSSTCAIEFCGDLVVQPGLGEACDDGNAVDEDGCSSACAIEECGDGVLQVGLGEACDDGNLVSEDGCSSLCAVEICGDGVVQAGLGEQCDDSNMLSGDGCSAACLVEFCGDGLLQVGLGEECDDGNMVSGDGCSDSCLNETCGDGVVNGSEECDDGNTVGGDGCSAICLDEVCGNGVLDPGEACDDGNLVSEDGCSAVCAIEFCGDLVVQAGLGETCDDGNAVDEDGCSSACAIEECGDGVLQAGLGEACDDGNLVSEDGCSSTCAIEECGDGVLQAGLGEECDDGNTAPGDGCDAACLVELCGNGVLDPGEYCDDGNLEDGDGCTALCFFEPEPVPTVPAWGLLALAVGLLSAGSVLLQRRADRLAARR